MANTVSRPEFLRNNDLREHLRWQKQTTDNIDVLVKQLTEPSFVAITRSTISGISYANATSSVVSFDMFASGAFASFGIPTTVASQGTALSWSLANPQVIYVNETGFYLVNSEFSWNAAAGGTERSITPYNAVRYENMGSANGVASGFNVHNTFWMGQLLKGDTVQLNVYQNSGAPLGEAYVPRLAVLKLTI